MMFDRERNDSGLDHSADELDRRPTFSLDDEDDDDFHEDDEGVFHEDPLVCKPENLSFYKQKYILNTFIYGFRWMTPFHLTTTLVSMMVSKTQ